MRVCVCDDNIQYRTALYILVPIKEATGSLFWGLAVGLIWSTISIHFAMYMFYIEKQLNKHQTMKDTKSINLDMNFIKAVKMINNDQNKWIIWGVIITLFCGKGVVDTFANDTQTAYVNVFGMSEMVADWCLSVTAFVGLGFGAALGYIIGKIGQLSKTFVLATFLMTSGISMLGANSTVPWFNIFGNVYVKGGDDDSVSAVPWVSTVLYSFGLEIFFISGYSSLFTVVPIELMSMASSFVAVLTYGSSMIGTYVFGMIAEYSNFSYGFVFLGIWSMIGLVWSVFVDFDDGRKNKLLRRDRNCNEKNNSTVS